MLSTEKTKIMLTFKKTKRRDRHHVLRFRNQNNFQMSHIEKSTAYLMAFSE